MFIFLLSLTLSAQTFNLPAENMSEFIPVAPNVAEQVIGYYNNGCILGAKPFATSTNGWELMNTTRNHQYGHSSLVDFTTKLANQSVAKGWGKLTLGDSSCPMGGKMHEGHSSHQVGLDVDIFFKFIPRGQTLTHAQRNAWDEKAQEANEIAKYKRPYIDENKPVEASMTSNLRPEYLELVRLAAQDERVQRIFVSPTIKREMCKVFAGANGGAWLAKVRPEGGHRSHFHVRLRCPADSPKCKSQDPVPASNGCGTELEAAWFKPIERPKPSPPPPPKIPPQACLDARAAHKPVKLNETSLCLTDADGSLRCRDYQKAENFSRPKPASGSSPAAR
jgi:penicillin-insensitive murein endopeptidase